MADVAAFDFDGTLTEGGSVFDFLVAVTDRATVTTAAVALAPRLAQAALVGGEVADQAKQLLFTRVLAGVDVGHVGTVSQHFAERHLAGKLRGDVRDRLDWHRDRGDRVVIVSASPECYVAEAGSLLGAHAVIATQLEVAPDGTLTGRYRGRNCRGEEKIVRLRAWIADADGSPADGSRTDGSEAPGSRTDGFDAAGSARRNGTPRLWAYGNSRGDLRMLHAADVGVNVGRLGPLGRLRAFPTLASAPTS